MRQLIHKYHGNIIINESKEKFYVGIVQYIVTNVQIIKAIHRLRLGMLAFLCAHIPFPLERAVIVMVKVFDHIRYPEVDAAGTGRIYLNLAILSGLIRSFSGLEFITMQFYAFYEASSVVHMSLTYNYAPLFDNIWSEYNTDPAVSNFHGVIECVSAIFEWHVPQTISTAEELQSYFDQSVEHFKPQQIVKLHWYKVIKELYVHSMPGWNRLHILLTVVVRRQLDCLDAFDPSVIQHFVMFLLDATAVPGTRKIDFKKL